MRKKEQNEVWIMWMVKALLAAYVVTGILLIILALALYKFELNEAPQPKNFRLKPTLNQ